MTTSEDQGLVLAGGTSRRFDDGDKALATIDGRPLLATVVATVRKALDSPPLVAVASREQSERYRSMLDGPVRFVTDAPDGRGPLAGLTSAVDGSRADWLFIVGCDMPLVSESAIEWLATRRTPDVGAVVPRTADRLHPIHAWYRRTAVKRAVDSPRTDPSLQALFDSLSTATAPAEAAPEAVPLERSLFNVNTVADLQRVRDRTER